MNILVIGGTRLMGKHLVHELLLHGHQVTIASRGLTADDFGCQVNRIILDRYNEKSIQDQLSSLSFDVVYDSLAYASNDVKILLDHIHCQKYIMISTAAVYEPHLDTKESDFNPYLHQLVWCHRNDDSYANTKRQAEAALVQSYSHIQSIFVRFPFVIGEDDYTNRLKFYVDHVINQQPMFIDNDNQPLAFIDSQEAGQFLAFLADKNFSGPIHGANEGAISVKEIIEYIEKKTNKSAILNNNGDMAPYNGLTENTLNTDQARQLGFIFSPLKDIIFKLLNV